MDTKHMAQLFKMKRCLEIYSQELGHAYKCETKLLDFDPSDTKLEGDKTYHYPAMFYINIESWETFKVSFRPSDGRWFREGQDMCGKGISTAQMYRRVRNNLRTHAQMIQTRKETK